MWKWFSVLVCFVACASPGRMPIQSDVEEGRTLASINAEGSCGCPAGYSLSCEAPNGDVFGAQQTCMFLPPAEGFSFTLDDAFREMCGASDDDRVSDVLFCDPI